MANRRTYELSFDIYNSDEPQKVTFDVYDGAQGEKGDTGEGFSIAKEYSSIEEMNADYNNSEIPLHSFVLINTNDVDDPDNAKLYVKAESGFSFLTDLSGAQGIKGEKGSKGDKGDKGDKGNDGYTPEKGVDYFTEEDKAEINSYVETFVNTQLNKTTSITSGADLDSEETYFVPGKYTCSSSDIASTLRNCPTKTNFVLYTFIRTGSTRTPSQLIIDASGILFIRSRISDKWNPWRRYAYHDEINELIQSVITSEGLATKDYVDEQVSKVATDFNIAFEFLDSEDELPDEPAFGTVYVVNGMIYQYGKHKIETNLVLDSLSITDNSIYNSIGYKVGTYVGSSGTYKDSGWQIDEYKPTVTGLIPFTDKTPYYIEGGLFKIYEVGEIPNNNSGNTESRMSFFSSDKTYLGQLTNNNVDGNILVREDLDETGKYFKLTVDESTLGYSDKIAYFSISLLDCEEPIVSLNPIYEYWYSTGQSFIPTDNEDRIITLENDVFNLNNRVEVLEQSSDTETVLPKNWQDHIDERIKDIRKAMATTGRHKSAFLWYNDSHWTYNSKMSPKLLKYLYENTPINKTNYGGDVVNGKEDIPEANPDEYAYLYEWRKTIRDLPNHHSVRGNHDDDIFTQNQAIPIYSFLMAAEETSDIVRGSEMYYYIDEPSERTRYLYLDTYHCTYKNSPGDPNMVQFIIDVLSSLPSDWHAVAISHIWWLYNSVGSPEIGEHPGYCKQIIDLFTSYNNREKGIIQVYGTTAYLNYDFSNADATFEFCIGGHTHIDQTFWSEGEQGKGFPIILTETDSYHLRGNSQLIGTQGTNESSVNAIVANYFTIPKMINIIRIGRGESRIITYTGNNSAGIDITPTLNKGKIDTGNGNIISADNYLYSDLISIENRKTYAMVWDKCTVSVKICYYDENENFIYNENLYEDGNYIAQIATECQTDRQSSGSAIIPIITRHSDKEAKYFRLRIYLNKFNGNYQDSEQLAQKGITIVRSV